MVRYYEPIKLAYRVFEAAGGSSKALTPVIFMHDIYNCKEVWHSIPQLVADRTKRMVFAYDARNHGESEYTSESDFNLNVPDLYTFMSRMQIESSILVGHCFGGMTAISAALEEPKKVEKAFVLDMSVTIPRYVIESKISEFSVWPEKFDKLFKITKNPEKFMELLFDSMAPVLFGKLAENPEFTKAKKDYLISHLCKKLPDGTYGLNFNYRTLQDALKIYHRNPVINCGMYHGPAYFMFGTYALFKAEAEEVEIKKHFPRAEVEEVRAATSNFFTDNPKAFADYLIRNM
ncbi:sn-1-specific diacylglycerol lipase ABHD11 [Parasteatoda tepidariorum]|nr:protein ABHD11 [Parasteatoda tepidariorum]